MEVTYFRFSTPIEELIETRSTRPFSPGLCILVLVSIGPIRRRWYPIFKAGHHDGVVLFLGGMNYHSSSFFFPNELDASPFSDTLSPLFAQRWSSPSFFSPYLTSLSTTSTGS